MVSIGSITVPSSVSIMIGMSYSVSSKLVLLSILIDDLLDLLLINGFLMDFSLLGFYGQRHPISIINLFKKLHSKL